MKKFITYLLLFNLVSILHAHSSGETGIIHLPANPQTMPNEIISRKQSINLRETVNDNLKVDVHFRNFTECDKQKVRDAIVILERVMNSEEFKERVLSFTFKGETRFHQNNNMTNQEIYDLLMTGEEVLIPGADGVMNFDLTLYRSWNPFSKVKGYTLPDTIRIWLNKKFFRRSSWTSVDVASNMAHEWVHKMGFGHDYNYNSDRPYSVPYAIGHIVGEVAREFGY